MTPHSVVSAVSPSPSSSDPPNGDYALDGQTVDTPDWACIRKWESGDDYTDLSGAYGFVGADYGGMSVGDQDALALRIFNTNEREHPGRHFLGAWNGSTEKCGLT